jgi:hypothetical protein
MAGISVTPLILNGGLGVSLSAVMCLGMKAMKGLSNLSAPLLGFTLLCALFFAKGTVPAPLPLTISWIGGLSLIIGGGIASVIDLPTFFQHARSKKDACIAVVLLYGVIVPFIEGVGLYLSAVTGGESILQVFQSGHGVVWMIWMSCFILLCGWTTNSANLYSATASSHSLLGQGGFKARIFGLGVVGTAIACFNPLGNLAAILTVFGITIGSMGAVILVNYLLEIRRYKLVKSASFVSWFLGVGSGLASLLLHFSFTGVAALDAFLITACAQIGITMINQRKKSYETTHSQ